MDRLLCSRLTHHSAAMKHMKQLLPHSRLLKSLRGLKNSTRDQRPFLTQLTTISAENRNICESCLSSRHHFLKILQFHKIRHAFQKQVEAMSCLMMRSDWFSSLVRLKYLPETQGTDHMTLFNKTDPALQDRVSSGDKSDDKGREQGQPGDEDEMDKRKRQALQRLYTFVSVGLLVWILTTDRSASMENQYISWSDFYQKLLLKGEVKSIELHFSPQSGEDVAVIYVHDGAVINGQRSGRKRFVIKIPSGFNFEERVREVEDELSMSLNDRIPITYSHPNSWLQLTFQVLFILGAVFLMRKLLMSAFPKPKGGKPGEQGDIMDMLSGGLRKAKYTRGDIAAKIQSGKAVSFKDVAGLKEAKLEVMEFISYLTKPEIYKNLGAKTPRGALLLGPPGCGKTLLARALATEAGVPFLNMAGSEFVEMIGGVGAARVRSLFKDARAKAPCIIYIDEIDAIGKKRASSGQAGGGEDEHTLNQLLVEMDGVGTQEGVIVLAATNRADILDKALLRPGRFDRHIMIDLPTLAEREEIFGVYLSKLKLAQPPHVYARPMSRLTPGMSGADIANICNEAAIHAARDQRTSVDKDDFEYAVERVIAGTEKKTRLLSPTEKKVVAYHESGHALVGWMLKHTDALLRISIVPRTNSALGFAQYLPSDQKLYSSEELFERMCMALGGRAAESLIFNHTSTGAQDDLQRVTKMAYAQISTYGMNERVGHVSFPTENEGPVGTKPYSQRLAATMDEEARRMVSQAFLHTTTVLQDNKDKLHQLATTLLDKEVLDYSEIEALIGPPPAGKKHTIEPQGWEGIMPSTEGRMRRRRAMGNKENKS